MASQTFTGSKGVRGSKSRNVSKQQLLLCFTFHAYCNYIRRVFDPRLCLKTPGNCSLMWTEWGVAYKSVDRVNVMFATVLIITQEIHEIHLPSKHYYVCVQTLRITHYKHYVHTFILTLVPVIGLLKTRDAVSWPGKTLFLPNTPL